MNKRGSTNKTRPASFARSVSPTISKLQAGQTKDHMKSLLQTTPHKQKSNITRNKNHGHAPQVDVLKPVATPVPPDVDMSPCKPKDRHVDVDFVLFRSRGGGLRDRGPGGTTFCVAPC